MALLGADMGMGTMPGDCVAGICSRWERLVGVEIMLLNVCK